MKTKLLILSVLMMLSLTSFAKKNIAVKDTSGYENNTPAMTLEQKKARLTENRLRIEEIRNMDKSNLSKVQRGELRAELKALKKEDRAIDDGTGGANIVWAVFGAFIVALIVYEVAKS